MSCRAKIKIIGQMLIPILILASSGSKPANAQVKLDAYYTATLLGLPIGHISWAVDLKESRLVRWLRDRSLDTCDYFWTHRDQSPLRVDCLTANPSHPNSN